MERRGKDSWRLVVFLGVDKQGRQIKRTKTIHTSSKREAEKQLSAFVTEVENGSYIKPSKLCLSEFAEQWLNYASSDLAPKTLYRYKQLLTTRILPELGHIKIDQIRPQHLLSFYTKLQQQDVRADGKAGGLSARTILHHHRLIHTILSAAYNWELILNNPASKVKPPKVPKEHFISYDLDTTHQLIAALDSEPIKYRAIVYLALTTGMRQGEIFGCRVSDLSFEDATLRICHSSQYLPGKGAFLKEPKNDSSKRIVTLPQSTVNILKEYLEHREQRRALLGDAYFHSDRLFVTDIGKPMYPATMSSWFPEFLRRHNLPPLRFHGLRSLSVSLLIALGEGLPIKNIAKRIGHTTEHTTLSIYAKAVQSVDRQIAEQMDKILTLGNTKTAAPN